MFWHVRDIPVVTPPFPVMWFEAARPPVYVIDGEAIEASRGLPQRWGAWVESQPADDGGWHVKATVFLQVNAYPQAFCAGDCRMRLSASGAVVPVAPGKEMLFAVPKADEEMSQRLMESIGNMLQPIWLALGFMNCRNVARTEARESRAERRDAKKRGHPDVKFYELSIGSMTRAMNEEGGAQTDGIAKALHICRGHFVTYDEKPLFGKHRGTFWKPAHVRGAAENGIVSKTYNVKAPRP